MPRDERKEERKLAYSGKPAKGQRLGDKTKYQPDPVHSPLRHITKYSPTGPVDNSKIPKGYPAYCFFIPTGIDINTDNKIQKILKTWGDSTGDVLYVATWDIGHRSVIDFLKASNVKHRPAIVLTDVDLPDINSFRITIDEPRIVKNEELLIEILPDLADFIITGEKKNALRSYAMEDNFTKINEIFTKTVGVLSKLSNYQLSVTPTGITIGPK